MLLARRSLLRLQPHHSIDPITNTKRLFSHKPHANKRKPSQNTNPKTNTASNVTTPVSRHSSNVLPTPQYIRAREDHLLRSVWATSSHPRARPGSPQASEDWEGPYNPIVGVALLNSYQALCDLGGPPGLGVIRYPLRALKQLTRHLFKTGQEEVLTRLVGDIIKVYSKSISRRVAILTHILELQAEAPLLSSATLNQVLEAFKAHAPVLRLPKRVTESLVVQAVRCLETSEGEALPKSLFGPMMHLLSTAPAPQGVEKITWRPSDIVSYAIRYIDALVSIGRRKDAMSVFQLLMDRGWLPAEALHHFEIQSDDFTFLVRSTLVRACWHWGWHTQASDMLVTILTLDSAHEENVVINLTLEFMHKLLSQPTVEDLVAFRRLARGFHARTRLMLPTSLIQNFYTLAHKLNSPREAHKLYAHLHGGLVESRGFKYSPPAGASLGWLMQYLFDQNDIVLCRELGREVMQPDSPPIRLLDRAEFIRIAAVSGFAFIARKLWERYAAGEGKEAVTGNSGTMIRVVAVFVNLVDRYSSVLAHLPIRRDPLVQPDKCELATPEEAQERVDDFYGFAERVVAEFRETIEPIATAHHIQLNALARAYFLLGKVTPGFDVFQTLMTRRELPDLYDVNVALISVAERDPASAARLIDRMLEQGLQPDDITFGTVIHQALAHGEMKLVRDMITKAKQLKRKLTLKTISSLIKATMNLPVSSKLVVRAHCQRVLQLVKQLEDAKYVCTPDTGRACVYACLRLDEPVMAFQFWQLLVKKGESWNDSLQLRRSIGGIILKHSKSGVLGKDQALLMMKELRLNGVFWAQSERDIVDEGNLDK